MGVIFPVFTPSTLTFAPEGNDVTFREPLPLCAERPADSKHTANALEIMFMNFCIQSSKYRLQKNLHCNLYWQFAIRHHKETFGIRENPRPRTKMAGGKGSAPSEDHNLTRVKAGTVQKKAAPAGAAFSVFSLCLRSGPRLPMALGFSPEAW